MGKFIEGYKIGCEIQNGTYNGEFDKEIKELIKTSKYNDCIEWYNGFYKGMLDSDLESLKQAFGILKKESENEK